MSLTLDAALARVPAWAGQALQTAPLGGGLTNHNIRVDVGGQSFVLRLPGDQTGLLGINRRHEHAATQAAASIGVGPEVVYFIEPEGCLITRFVAGRPIPPEAMRQPANLRRVAETLKRVHSLSAIPGAFSPFRVVEAYDALARQHGVDTFPADYGRLRQQMADIEAALLREPFDPKPCHNDLINENFLDDGALRLLDWEYAGQGDPAFDLANFSVNHELTGEGDRLLLEAYAGGVSPARFALMKIMSDFHEAMWGVAQQGLSALDFDYRAYADKHFARLTRRLADPHYPGWLAAFK